MNFLFTCGGTAGHINPALAVAGILRDRMPDCGILFVGANGKMETDLVPRAGYDIVTIEVTNIHRSLKPSEIAYNFRSLHNARQATKDARKIIEDFKPDVAIGTGGYVCYPVLKAAAQLGIPTVVHESNAVPGLTTKMLGAMNEGDYIQDFVGPLGKPTNTEGIKRVCVVGGGVGCAIALPSAQAFKEAGAEVDVIVGFRSKDIVILEDEFKACSDQLYLMTDDGSYGEHGFVTVKLQQLLEAGTHYDEVLAIGPIPMMKFVSKTTEPFGVKTVVSLNPIMVDGTGMCGGCRVTVGGEVKFACVDGPDFDGHKVDYDELMSRNSVYREREAEERKTHICRIQKMGEELIK